MNWKFWKWDLTGSKRIAALEKRLKELEDEVMPFKGGAWGYLTSSMFRHMWGVEEDCKPAKLTLRDKVNRICEHLKIEFEKQDAKYVMKIKKPKPSR